MANILIAGCGYVGTELGLRLGVIEPGEHRALAQLLRRRDDFFRRESQMDRLGQKSIERFGKPLALLKTRTTFPFSTRSNSLSVVSSQIFPSASRAPVNNLYGGKPGPGESSSSRPSVKQSQGLVHLSEEGSAVVFGVALTGDNTRFF